MLELTSQAGVIALHIGVLFASNSQRVDKVTGSVILAFINMPRSAPRDDPSFEGAACYLISSLIFEIKLQKRNGLVEALCQRLELYARHCRLQLDGGYVFEQKIYSCVHAD